MIIVLVAGIISVVATLLSMHYCSKWCNKHNVRDYYLNRLVAYLWLLVFYLAIMITEYGTKTDDHHFTVALLIFLNVWMVSHIVYNSFKFGMDYAKARK